ncbi:MAG: guanylate kinase, partial [Streblomastix strix]
GAGKSTIIQRIMNCIPNTFGFSVSHTTRQPREGEQHGIQYFFVSKEEYDQLIKENAFVEHAEVHGNCYGTSKAALDRVTAGDASSQVGKICILDIDIQGCKQIKQRSDIHPLFIRVRVEIEELKKRLEKRGTETAESLETRLANARGELAVITVDDSTSSQKKDIPPVSHLHQNQPFFDLEVDNVREGVDGIIACARQIVQFLEDRGILLKRKEGGREISNVDLIV